MVSSSQDNYETKTLSLIYQLCFNKMNRNLSILIRHAPDRETTMMTIYINDFFLTSNCVNIPNILKEALGWKYNIKDLEKV